LDEALDTSKDDVLAAIEKVGNSAAAVRKEVATSKPLDPDDFPLNAAARKSQMALPSRKLQILL
jgi:hypothetical protein